MKTRSRWSLVVRSAGSFLAATTVTACAAPEEGSAEVSEASVVATTSNRITVGTATFLKTAQVQAAELGPADKCAVAAGTAIVLEEPPALLPSGHLGVRPRALPPGCTLPRSSALYVFAPHARSREGSIPTSDGLAIHVSECANGVRAGKEVVVLLHPAGASAELWHASGVFEKLVAAGFCPVALDLRGHGESSKPRSPDAYDAARLQRDVLETVDALGIAKAHFHGYSLGGSILIRLLPALAARRAALSVAFGGAGLPEGAPDVMAGKSRARADAADAEAKRSAPPASSETEAAQRALFAKAPWTQPMAPIDRSAMRLPMLGMFGEFDNPTQNTRKLEREAPGYVGTVVFRDRLHVGTIAPATMPSSYGDVLVAFFGRSPLPTAADIVR